jgi:hypothetical protein
MFCPHFQLFFRKCHQEGPRISDGIGTEWNASFLIYVYVIFDKKKYHKEDTELY